jgi:hypothetical protein
MSAKPRKSPLHARVLALSERSMKLGVFSQEAMLNHFLGGFEQSLKWHKYGREHSVTPARTIELLETAFQFGESHHQACLAHVAKSEGKSV